MGARHVNEAQASNSRTVFLCIVRFSELTEIISQNKTRECRGSPSHNMNPASRRYEAEACPLCDDVQKNVLIINTNDINI